MAESKAGQDKAAPAPTPQRVNAPGASAPAGESSDPAVHQLLAELQTARSNDDERGVQAAQRALAELGFTAT